MGSEAKNETLRRALEALRSICKTTLTPEADRPAAEWKRIDPVDVPAGLDSDQFAVLDPLISVIVRWLDSRVWLDTVAVAKREPPRWCTSVTTLHADLCAWMFDRNQDVPPTMAEFGHLLRDLFFEIRLMGGEEFVSNVGLQEDVGAQQDFGGKNALSHNSGTRRPMDHRECTRS